MGFWENVGKFTSAIAMVAAAQQEAQRLIGLSEPVARRQLKSASRSANDDQWRSLISALDNLASTESGDKADLAARLAEYAETLV